ncbi:MAG TPA: hypothetical protein VFM38_05975, partial [Candidatus Limnocylindrales bacterium]|nr:hypothetical protein [Candidatus Limnocylindrales bacterium]
WVSVTEDALGGDLSNIAALARNAKTFATAFQDAGKAMFGPVLAEEDDPSAGESGFDVAVSIAVNVFDHTVQALVEPGAGIQSGTDIAVNATIEESVSLGAAGEATRNGADDNSVSQYTTATREDIEFGIGIGVYTSHARARVQDSVPDGQGGKTIAHLDAAGATTVEASVEYPLLIDSVNDVLNPAYTMKESGLDGFDFLTDGTLGFGSNLFNVWVTSVGGDPDSASADKFVFGGAAGITVFDLESAASIGSDAQINQGIDPAFTSDEQTVSVLATTTTELVSVGHIAALNLSLPALVEGGPDASQAIRRAMQPSSTSSPAGAVGGALKSIVNPFGVSGKKGIGAAVLATIITAETTAEVHPGAMIHTGPDGDGLTIKATQELLEVAVGYTGSQSTDFGLNLTLIVGTYDTDTIAGIQPGTYITGGPVTVDAHDTINRYVVAGQVLKTERVGIGISVGIAVADRTTKAYIGRADLSDEVPAAGVVIDVEGPVKVDATTDGEIVQVVVGGGLAMPEEDQRAQTKAPTKPPADKFDLSLLLTISVAVNDLILDTQASIDSALLSSDGVEVKATSEPVLRGITVAASIVVTKPQGVTHTKTLGSYSLDLSFAGAVGVNVVDSDVLAGIGRSNVDAGDEGVLVEAKDDSTVAADGGGVAVALSLGSQKGVLSGGSNVAIGAGVAVNWLD